MHRFIISRPIAFMAFIVICRDQSIYTLISFVISLIISEMLLALFLLNMNYLERYRISQYLMGLLKICSVKAIDLDKYIDRDKLRMEVDRINYDRQKHNSRWRRISEFSAYINYKNVQKLQIYEFKRMPSKYNANKNSPYDPSPRAFVDLHGRGFIFLPANDTPTYYSRFVVAHEIGHIVYAATLPMIARRCEPFGLLICIILAPFFLRWNIYVLFMYLILVLMFCEYWGRQQRYLDRVRRLESESAADSFASAILTIEDRSNILRLARKLTGFTDRNLTFSLNMTRIERLIRILTGHAVHELEYEVVYDPISRIIKIVVLFSIGIAWQSPTATWLYILSGALFIAIAWWFFIVIKIIKFDNELKDVYGGYL